MPQTSICRCVSAGLVLHTVCVIRCMYLRVLVIMDARGSLIVELPLMQMFPHTRTHMILRKRLRAIIAQKPLHNCGKVGQLYAPKGELPKLRASVTSAMPFPVRGRHLLNHNNCAAGLLEDAADLCCGSMW